MLREECVATQIYSDQASKLPLRDPPTTNSDFFSRCPLPATFDLDALVATEYYTNTIAMRLSVA
jgi:hypothetical protein